MILRSPLQPSIGTRSSAVPWQMQLTGAGVRDAINDPTAYGETLSPELVTNGTFDSDTWWGKDAGVSIAAGECTFASVVNNTGLFRASFNQQNKRVEITYTIRSITAGGFRWYINGSSQTIRTTPGTYTEQIVAGAADTVLILRAVGTTSGVIDNVSIREVLFGYLLPGLGGARLSGDCRTSVAMQTLADGSIGYSAHNLFGRSEEFDDALWFKGSNGTASLPVVTANFGASPTGAMTADRVVLALNGGTTTNDRSNVQQNISPATPGTFSVWVRSNTVLTYQIQLRAGNADTVMVVTPAWQRFSVSTVGSGDPTAWFALRGSQGTSDSCDILVWGAQLNLGPVATAYVPTTTAAVYAAAVDWHSAQSIYGLRSESAATNLLTWSTAFDDAAWLKTGSPITTVTPNTTIAPDGTLTADTITFGGSLGSDRIFQDTATAAANGTAVAGSVWLWAASPTTVSLHIERSGPFDTETTICNLTTTPTRFTMLHSATWTGTTVLRLRLADKAGGGAIYAWGAQLELGTRASSPILTFGATATRAADLPIVRDTAAGLIGQSQGTITVAAIASIIGTGGIVSINDGSAANRVDIRSNGTTTITLASTPLSSPTVATMVAGTLAKTSMSYSLRAAAASRAGSLPVPVGDAPGFTQLQLGGIDGGTTANLDGWITSLQIAQTSSLPASLQGMTA